MRSALAALGATLVLAGCGQPAPSANETPEPQTSTAVPAPSPAATPTADTAATGPSAPAQDAYVGRWIGVEGMYLDVKPRPAGGVTMEMQWDLDNKGTFDGSVTAEGLRFMRNGTAETAVFTDGDATGLKYLAGKKNCLTVKPGEGYCRD